MPLAPGHLTWPKPLRSALPSWPRSNNQPGHTPRPLDFSTRPPSPGPRGYPAAGLWELAAAAPPESNRPPALGKQGPQKNPGLRRPPAGPRRGPHPPLKARAPPRGPPGGGYPALASPGRTWDPRPTPPPAALQGPGRGLGQ